MAAGGEGPDGGVWDQVSLFSRSRSRSLDSLSLTNGDPSVRFAFIGLPICGGWDRTGQTRQALSSSQVSWGGGEGRHNHHSITLHNPFLLFSPLLSSPLLSSPCIFVFSSSCKSLLVPLPTIILLLDTQPIHCVSQLRRLAFVPRRAVKPACPVPPRG